MLEGAELSSGARVLDGQALERSASAPRGGPRTTLATGSIGGGHRAARVHTDTLAAMRRLEIARPTGRAQLDHVPTGWSVDLDASSHADAAEDLLAAAVHAVRDDGGGLLRLWARAGDPVVVSAGEAQGFELERELLQLRRAPPRG